MEIVPSIAFSGLRRKMERVPDNFYLSASDCREPASATAVGKSPRINRTTLVVEVAASSLKFVRSGRNFKIVSIRKIAGDLG